MAEKQKKERKQGEKISANSSKKTGEAELKGICQDVDCPKHGKLRARGRIFRGEVISKFPRRVAIVFEQMVHIRKYERYMMKKTKIHARLPDCMKQEVGIGDYIEVRECRPLSKIIHFVVIKKIREKEQAGGKK